MKITEDGLVQLSPPGEKMKICAVIRSQSASISMLIGGQLPYLIYLPHTALDEMSGSITADKLMVAMKRENQEAIEQIQKKLNRQFEGSYQYENLNHYLDSFQVIMDAISLLISGIAGISVIVGGIGVMNSMVSAVETRTKEIGIYRALGAKKRTILQTFVLEAVLLCLTGGICGVMLSKGTIHLIEMFLGVKIQFQWSVVIASLGLSAICGVLFGMLPAMRAARLDPIKAIRSE